MKRDTNKLDVCISVSAYTNIQHVKASVLFKSVDLMQFQLKHLK